MTKQTSMKTKLFFLIPLLFLLQGCSWSEYFVITNETNADIIIEYEVSIPSTGFSIFSNQPKCYKLHSDRTVYSNEIRDITDFNSEQHLVKVVLPSNNGLIIGGLSNDNYKSYDQYFINGRHFNLKNLKIQHGETVIEITPANFDRYFVKHKNLIACKIK